MRTKTVAGRRLSSIGAQPGRKTKEGLTFNPPQKWRRKEKAKSQYTKRQSR